MNYSPKYGKGNNKKVIEKIQKKYEDTQKIIYTSYFNNVLYMLEDLREIDEYKEKLINFEKEINLESVKKEYEIYKEKQLEKLNKRMVVISRRNSYNSLTVISSNKIFKIFKIIRNIFIKDKS